MKKRILLISLLLVIIFSLQAQAVQGELFGMDGKKVLKVWGTHYQRGYAMGYLLGDEIMTGFNSYFLTFIFQGNAVAYNIALNYYHTNFAVDDIYVQEVDGILAGVVDAGNSIFAPSLNRDINTEDILMLNAIVDLSTAFDLGEFGCSSLSSWASATLAAPQLNGDVVITRNLDWTNHQFLFDSPLLIVHFPTETDEQPWMSFAYPGFIGALSAINQSSVSAFLNMGNNHSHIGTQIYNPILLSIRDGVEKIDYNADGQCNTDDITQAISDNIQLSGHIVHCTDASGGMVIECNNAAGVVVRTSLDNVYIPQDNLVATNHFRSLYPSTPCSRYGNFIDSLAVSYEVTLERSWDVTANAGGVSTNLQTIEYAQSANCIKWATALYGLPAYQQDPVYYEIDWLFEQPTAVSEDVATSPRIRMQAFPNPFSLSGANRSAVTTIRFSMNSKTYEGTTPVAIDVFNIKGQRVKQLSVSDDALLSGTSSSLDGSDLSYAVTWDGRDSDNLSVSSGVYFCRLSSGTKTLAMGKLLLMR